MPHHNLAGELVGKASGYVVESCDAVHPPKAASQLGGNALHAGSRLLQINTRQIKTPCVGLCCRQLETHHLNLRFRDSYPRFVVSKVLIGDSGKPRVQAGSRLAGDGFDPASPVRNVNIGSPACSLRGRHRG